MIITGCGQSNSQQSQKNTPDQVSDNTQNQKNNLARKNSLETNQSDSLPNQISEKSKNESNDFVKQDSIESNQTEKYRSHSLDGFEKATVYKLSETITADFNGDGVLDKAYFKKENADFGIIIKHGKTNEEIKIGFGKNHLDLTELDWVDYWGLVEDKKTRENIFSEQGDLLESKDVLLQNPSIAIGADEVGGGLITFLNGKYVYIHQTC
ncbi:MAG: hypothetical protein C4K58_06715 [Flavobacteriaceae bacterium]|nr:MAG: hypothetical protein C4K58_06715 [Flavobacteriaceae bacterium]